MATCICKRWPSRFIMVVLPVGFILLLLSFQSEYDNSPKGSAPSSASYGNITKEVWLQIQKERVDLMQAVCRQMSLEKVKSGRAIKLSNNNHLVDNINKAVMCTNPKAASTNWITVFLKMTGKFTALRKGEHVHFINVIKRTGVKLLEDYTSKQIEKIVTEYSSFIVVRDPMDRLQSAFKNKIAAENSTNISLRNGLLQERKDMIRLYRPDADKTALRTGVGVQFQEFVRYVTDGDEKHVNTHWQRYHELCTPCGVDYTYIVKYETMMVDIHFLFLLIYGVEDGELFFPPRYESDALKDKHNHIADLDEADRSRLNSYYKWDLKLFGYKPL